MARSNDTGFALEEAVHHIEKTILENNPKLLASTFTIEKNKIVEVEGVRHEIDIYVTVDMGHGYDSIFIFECKNWKKAVGKNEIIIFSEKVRALGATSGFFVAKNFSKFATAQAEIDKRIELLLAKEHGGEALMLPFSLHFLLNNIDHYEIVFLERGVIASKSKSKTIQSEIVVLNDQKVNLRKYIESWGRELLDGHFKKISTHEMKPDVYQLALSSRRCFDSEKLLVDGMDIFEVRMNIKVTSKIEYPRIVSVFDVATRGRFIRLAPVMAGTNELKVNLAFTT